MCLSRDRASEIIGNTNFGNIDNLLSQGRDTIILRLHRPACPPSFWRGWTQEKISEIVGLKGQRISQIINNTIFGKIDNLLSSGTFVLPDRFGFLEELGIMAANSAFTNCFFTSNHASNYLPIRARMPKEKDETVRLIYNVIQSRNRGALKPEYMRGL